MNRFYRSMFDTHGRRGPHPRDLYSSDGICAEIHFDNIRLSLFSSRASM
jgi:hypothetical protein